MTKGKKKQDDQLMQEIDYYLDTHNFKFNHFEIYSLAHKRSLKRIDMWVNKKLLKGAGFLGTIVLFVYFFYKSIKFAIAKSISTKVVLYTIVATTVATPPTAYIGYKTYNYIKQKQEVRIEEKAPQDKNEIKTNKTKNNTIKKMPEEIFKGIKEISIKSNFLTDNDIDSIKWAVKEELKRSTLYDYEAQFQISKFSEEYYIFYKLINLKTRDAIAGDEVKVADEKRIKDTVRELSKKMYQKYLK